MSHKLKSICFLTFFLCSIALYYALEPQAAETFAKKAETEKDYAVYDAKI